MRFRVLLGVTVLVSSPAWAIFTNGGFESGDFTGWTQEAAINQGLSGSPPFNSASLNFAAGGAPRNAVVGAGPDAQAPSLVLPRAGSRTARVNDPTQAGGFMSSIKQVDVIQAADRDPSDNKLHVRFSYAAVLEDSGHDDNERPFFFVRLRNVTKNTLLFEDFTYENQPGKTFIPGTGDYRNTAFTNVDIVVADADLGDTLEIQALASDCSPTAHPAYVYLDGFGSAVLPPVNGGTNVAVPTLSEWALILLSLGLLVVGVNAGRRGSPRKLL